MNAARQAVWLFFLLLALACSGFYFASSIPVKHLDDQLLAKSADTIISNFTLRRFDEKGRLIHYLQSPEVQHIPENNSHFISTPYLLLTQADQSIWEIRAQQAKAIKGGQEIKFIHDVIIKQNQEGQGGGSLKTEELTYFPQTKLARTDLPVLYEQPGGIIRSQGMIAYLEEKRVQLLSRARATFEPKHA